MKFTKDQMLKLYEELVHVRTMNNKIVEFIFSGRIAGAIHPSLGQEAIVAGLLYAYENHHQTVYRSFTHRQQAIMARSAGIDGFLAELMNRATGTLGGIAGEYHLVKIDKLMLPLSGVLGVTPPTATGFAWSLKLDGRKDAVVCCPFGDGMMSEGYVYEAMNIASIHKVPILFVIENNGMAMTTPLEWESPIEDLYLRGISAGMKGASVDGNDIEATVEALMEGLDQAGKCNPNVIELKTVRWEGHFVGDKQEVYRDLSFRDNLDKLDPVLRYEKVLLERGVANEDHFAKVKADQEKIMAEAFEKAASAPFPKKEDFLNPNIVYTNTDGLPIK
ncbi:MAG: thiamine pyrophosphate-dependent dehydrogenase E1 component subunit alpha [Ruminococcaceae bacterium]|nr:thiamine pyrophosphate-dependent dehydrogenase E1 component subunit alpha [Oscillospiraceae bacterium]